MNRAKTNGFTLIELTLAMAFISMLMLAVAMTTIQVSNIYTKGVTLRELNQVGRQITTQVQQDINSSQPFVVDPNADATQYVSSTSGGRLCLGQYTYVWTYGKSLPPANGATNTYKDGTAVRFARVNDPSSTLCASPLPDVDKTQATELLTGGDRDLAVQAFSISRKDDASAPNAALYTVKLTLGTNDQQEIDTNNASCKPPTEGDGMQDYCAVNEFTIVAAAGNRAGEGQ